MTADSPFRRDSEASRRCASSRTPAFRQSGVTTPTPHVPNAAEQFWIVGLSSRSYDFRHGHMKFSFGQSEGERVEVDVKDGANGGSGVGSIEMYEY